MTQDSTNAAPGSGGSRLVDMVSETASQKSNAPLLSKAGWIKILILAAAFVALTGWQYRKMAITWIHDTNWTHGFVIPLFSLFLLYQRRYELFTAPRRASYLGLAVMVLGIFLMFGIYVRLGFEYGTRLMIPLTLLGLVWFQAGKRLALLTWLPIFYLVFAFPMSDFLYERISLPLQNLAAKASAIALSAVGVRVEINQSHMEIVSISGKIHPLTVAEACSGVRSLMAFAALGVAWAYVVERPLWQRVVLVLSIVPVAVFCNLIRVTITSAMFALDKPELGQDFMHTFLGMLMLIPAAGIFWLISLVLSLLFVENDDQPDTEETTPSPAPGAASDASSS
jgi:exosortase